MATQTTPGLARLARKSGALAMVAIDQRESLRTILQSKRSEPISDNSMVDFKVAVAEHLAPHASAMLFDRQFGLPAFEMARLMSGACGRILACDKLTQEPGHPVTDTDIDTEVDPEAARAQGAVALKLLVVWRGEENAKRCVELASEFMARCHGASLLGILEGVVRAPHHAGAGWDRETSILEAAHALGSAKPDLYKCEVPFQGRGDEALIRYSCERITESVSCPWVVLSADVAVGDFPRAVEIACRAGASGFLAGRAIWSDTVGGTNYRADLQAVAVPRLLRLADIVDSAARPWYAQSAGPEAKVD